MTTIFKQIWRVGYPNKFNWQKLWRLCKYFNVASEEYLVVIIDTWLNIRKWHIDVTFVAHDTFRSHNGRIMTMLRLGGALITLSIKKRLNYQISGKFSVQINYSQKRGELWEYSIYRQSGDYTPLKNGTDSTSKFSRHINSRKLFVEYLVQNNLFCLEYCCTTDMVVGFFTKPLQVNTFKRFRNWFVGTK